MLIFGKRSVIERLKTNPQSVLNLYFQEGFDNPEIHKLARRNKIPTRNLFSRKFLKLSRGALTQGVIAEVERYKYQDIENIFAGATHRKATLICLDRITDPQNLGAILRICACLGEFSVILPKHESAEINETVMKVACGAENYVSVCRVTNLAHVIKKAKNQGYCTAATVTQGGEDLRLAKLNFPLCIIFGSEGKGIREGLLKHIDYKLTLPMQGVNLSLNVAMTVGIFCYEAYCQR
jgi:23S rRNA (guanosine2251-2'-O)-methyltransferase